MKTVIVVFCLVTTAGCGNTKFTPSTSRESADSGQAPAEGTVTENFTQQEKYAQLDILLVIDNSASMGDEQEKLKQNLSHLLVAVSDSDWQIAVIGTSYRSCLRGPTARSAPNHSEEYNKLVDLGTMWGEEFHVNAAIRGLENRCQQTVGQPWLRDNSDIAILIVSDQCNECSTSPTACRVDGQLPAGEPCLFEQLQAHLKKLRPKGNARVYGIVDYDGHFFGSGDDATFYQGWRLSGLDDLDYLDFHRSIEADNYQQILEEISEDISSTLPNRFQLKSLPQKGSLTVTVAGEKISQDSFQVVGQTIVFDQGFLPPADAVIVAEYSPVMASQGAN